VQSQKVEFTDISSFFAGARSIFFFSSASRFKFFFVSAALTVCVLQEECGAGTAAKSFGGSAL